MPEHPVDPLEEAFESMRDTSRYPLPDLDPGTVRGLGDRRRRRRRAVAGGSVAAAAVAVLAGAVLVVGGGPEPEPLPAGPTRSTTPTPSSTPPAPSGTAEATPTGPPTTTPTVDATPTAPSTAPPPSPAAPLDPATMPLTAGYPDTNEDGTATRVERGPGPGVDVCGQTILTGRDARSVAVGRFLGGEDFRSRTLVVFSDEAEARAALEWTAATVRDCVGSPDLPAGSSVTVLGEAEGPGTFLWSQDYGPVGGPAMATGIRRLVLLGDALLVDTVDGEAWGPGGSADDEDVVATREALVPVVEAVRGARGSG
ncbi:hypothetical protein KC207_09605 [Phycicoccus sp. BSK3Z-2]|uniref:Uncharacterized protein n=1 Tax=Phycicoccus avicenniae TaxID=2828860 RepID=A0A941HZ06_9MICO|nr:hypothetical protein [Phycicoccus avicenniae]MBR7743543.1 hypothetical protein [Phycicoccus avicenniae]